MNSYFDGEISDVVVFDTALTGEDLYGASPRSDYVYFTGEVDTFDFTRSAGQIVVGKGGVETTLTAATAFAAFDDVTVTGQRISSLVHAMRMTCGAQMARMC